MKKFLLILGVLMVFSISSSALDLSSIAIGAGRQILSGQQQKLSQDRAQCFANCNNDGNCMQGCAAAYASPAQSNQRLDLSCMTRCSEQGSLYDFCKSRCSY